MTDTFEFQARHAFLTYSQTPNFTIQEIVDFVKNFNPQFYAVAEERHEDGGQHIHCLLKWLKRFHTRNPRAFDYSGFHPNIVVPRNVKKCLEYVTKDGLFEST